MQKAKQKYTKRIPKPNESYNHDNTMDTSSSNDQVSDPYISMTMKLFHDFTKTHTNELENLKVHAKQLAEETQNLTMIIIEKDAMIKSLNEIIEAKQEEITKYEDEQTKVKAAYKQAQINEQESQQRYSELETTYDTNLNHVQHENSELKKEIEMYKNENMKLTEEFAANRNDLQAKLSEKEIECAAINGHNGLEIQKNFVEYKEKLTNLQNYFETYKMELEEVNAEREKQMTEAFELRIANLNDQLQEKENCILQIKKEKCVMAELKNKMINEQSFKIKQIENAFTQPLAHVALSQQQNRVSDFHVEKRTNIATVAAANIATQASHSSGNEFSTDNESLVSNWHPNISSNMSKNQGFILRKRSYQSDTMIPETSKADNIEQAKHSK